MNVNESENVQKEKALNESVSNTKPVDSAVCVNSPCSDKKKLDIYELLSFVLTAVIAVLFFSFSSRMFFGNYTIMHGDFEIQNIPFMKLFINKILKSGDLFDIGKFFYSFSYGMGDDAAAQYAYFSCFSPFNIFYYIFSDDNIASCFLVVFKLAAAGWLFYRFEKKVLKKTGNSAMLFAMMYGLCGYNVLFYFNSHFLEGVYMLPVVMIGIYKLIKEKNIRYLAVAYGYLFITCFYSGYVVGFYSFFVIMIFGAVFCKDPETGFDKKKYICILGRFCLATAVGVLLSCFIILPAAEFILLNKAPDTSLFTGFEHNILDVYGNLFVGSNQGFGGRYPYYYSGLIILLIIPAFLIIKPETKKEKYIKYGAAGILLIMAACTFLVPCYLFMHCFDAPNGTDFRFAYLVSFSILAIASYSFDKIVASVKNKTITVSLCIINIILYLAAWFVQSKYVSSEFIGKNMLGFEINAILLIAYTLIIVFAGKNGMKKKYAGIMAVLVSVELCLNGVLILCDNQHDVAGYKPVNEVYFGNQDLIAEKVSSMDSSWYRIYCTNEIQNSALRDDYHGIGYFSTFENYRLRYFLCKLGYSTSVRSVVDYGSTELTRMLFAQKYLSEMSIMNNEYGNVTVVENPRALPLGYVVDSDILMANDYSDNIFENNNDVLSAMVGKEVRAYKTYGDSVDVRVDNVNLYSDETGELNTFYFELDDESKEGTIDFIVSGEDTDADVYAYFPQAVSRYFEKIPQIYSVGGDIGNEIVATKLMMPHNMLLGKNEDGNYNVEILITPDMSYYGGDIYGFYFYYLDEDVLVEVYNELSKNVLIIKDIQDGYVQGVVNADEYGDVLFTSIPYNKYWRAYVDGVESPIVPLLDGNFIGIELTDGVHEIELIYDNNLYPIGAAMTVIGILILVINAFGKKKKENTEENTDVHNEEHNEKKAEENIEEHMEESTEEN